MNSSNHCFQSYISLTEHGCGGIFTEEVSSKWKHHHSFPVKWKIVLPVAPQGQAVVLQLAAAARDGVPTAGQCRFLAALHSRQTHQIHQTHQMCWAWGKNIWIPSHILAPCLLASHTFGLQGHHHDPTQPSAVSCWGHLGLWVCLRWKQSYTEKTWGHEQTYCNTCSWMHPLF